MTVIAPEVDDTISKNTNQSVGLPGRLFVVPFVVVLVLLGVVLFAVAARFQTIMAQLEEARSLWPDASVELGLRYNRLNELFEVGSIGDAAHEDWTIYQREFRASSQFDRQSSVSLLIENQIRQSLKDFQRADSDFEMPGILKLREVERRRKKSQHDITGWLTVQGLRLKLPPIYDPPDKRL